jgi:hypothetical protein
VSALMALDVVETLEVLSTVAACEFLLAGAGGGRSSNICQITHRGGFTCTVCMRTSMMMTTTAATTTTAMEQIYYDFLGRR